MATPAYVSQSPVHSSEIFAGAQLDLLSPLMNDSLIAREMLGTFALSFSPQLVRYLVQAYSRPGDVILDPFLGSGTTFLEAELMRRRPIGIDCNEELIESVCRRRLVGPASQTDDALYRGDARDLSGIVPTETVDLIVTQPPYGNSHKFSKNYPHDLSHLTSQNFLQAIEQVASELYRVLKPDGICAILIGDYKDRGRMMPLGFQLIHRFLSRGFSVQESFDHHTPTAHLPVSLQAHEYLLIFRKKQKAPKRPRMTN